MMKLFIVERKNFMAWADGILMDVNAGVINSVGDDERHEIAKQIMDEGGTIGLTFEGHLISTMSKLEGTYVEVPYVSKADECLPM